MKLTIYLAYDGSINADWVARYALNMAANGQDLQIILIHILDYIYSPDKIAKKIEAIKAESAVRGIRIDDQPYFASPEKCLLFPAPGYSGRGRKSLSVRGQIIILAEGDKITADAKVVEAEGLLVDNAPLSGEANPCVLVHGASWSRLVESNNIAFAGCTVIRGSGKAVVFATGLHTEFGKLAHLSQEIKRAFSPLEQETAHMVQVLTVIAVSTGFVFLINHFYHNQAGFFKPGHRKMIQKIKQKFDRVTARAAGNNWAPVMFFRIGYAPSQIKRTGRRPLGDVLVDGWVI